MQQADIILRSREMNALRYAAIQGVHRDVVINGVQISVEPGLSGSGIQGMTNVEAGGFILSTQAFSSSEQLAKTVLHELHRLNTSNALAKEQHSADSAKSESQSAFSFADRAFNFMYLVE